MLNCMRSEAEFAENHWFLKHFCVFKARALAQFGLNLGPIWAQSGRNLGSIWAVQVVVVAHGMSST